MAALDAVPLTIEEIRVVARFAADGAEAALALFEAAEPDDGRPRAAVGAARAFAGGAPRGKWQRVAATDANRAAAEAGDLVARHAARAAAAASAAAYLHPLPRATQVRHILGAAAHAAYAAELAAGAARSGSRPTVGERLIADLAAGASPHVGSVLRRYPLAPPGRSRPAVLMVTLDAALRNRSPAPMDREDGAASDPGPFFHGTRADVASGELLEAGHGSNFGAHQAGGFVYFTGTLHAAKWGAALAVAEGRGRIYMVEPTGPFEDDPNLTNARFPGNPTRSFRSRDPLLVVGELVGWEPHPADQVQAMRDRLGELARRGIEALDD